MAVLEITIDDGVHADMLTYVRRCAQNDNETVENFLTTFIKRRVKDIRWEEVTEENKDSLIDITGL